MSTDTHTHYVYSQRKPDGTTTPDIQIAFGEPIAIDQARRNAARLATQDDAELISIKPEPYFADLRRPGLASIGTAEERAKAGTERSLDGKTLLVLGHSEHGTTAHRILDERDATMVTRYLAARDPQRTRPLVGDYVDFADGTIRRVSHDWGPDADNAIQTSGLHEGRYHLLSDGDCSFSGTLEPGAPADRLTPTEELRYGRAWIFHHDRSAAHNGVEFLAPFRAFTCDQSAT